MKQQQQHKSFISLSSFKVECETKKDYLCLLFISVTHSSD